MDICKPDILQFQLMIAEKVIKEMETINYSQMQQGDWNRELK